MTDHLTRQERSENMRRIKSADTLPERQVRATLRRLKIKYKSHPKDLKGTPDFFLKEKSITLFVHGCFWHCHTGCKRSNVPKSNQEYWTSKIKRNVARDRKTQRVLRKDGFRSVVVWECIANKKDKLEKFLTAKTK